MIGAAVRKVINENLPHGYEKGMHSALAPHQEIARPRFYFGQAARSFAAIAS